MFGGYPMSFFANGLANEVGRSVVDRTGLAGNWDFELTYTRDAIRQPDVGDPAPANVDLDGSVALHSPSGAARAQARIHQRARARACDRSYRTVDA
jgi:uncharacterized protein (TIGR03435 family)